VVVLGRIAISTTRSTAGPPRPPANVPVVPNRVQNVRVATSALAHRSIRNYFIAAVVAAVTASVAGVNDVSIEYLEPSVSERLDRLLLHAGA
jgi:hypothetical protein